MELKVIDDEPTDWVVIKPSLSTTKPVPILRATNRAPPVTLSEVVVALPLLKLPKAESPATLREPNRVPPVTDKDVVVAAPARREPSEVPP